jgi:iron-sulfur cluster repair protein YtfE (RIC family)
MSDLDIVALVLAEHQAIRRSFATLQSLDDRDQLASSWQDLANRLEVHASAEEEMLYPKLLKVADPDSDSVSDSDSASATDSASDSDSASATAETDDAIRDHNEIRHTAHAVADHEVGSDGWWEAVQACQEANEHHLDEEERDVLPDLKENAGQDALDALGEQWLAFHDEHDGAQGLSGEDKDPERYVEENA